VFTRDDNISLCFTVPELADESAVDLHLVPNLPITASRILSVQSNSAVAR
jgi:hypothetical protein